MRSVCSRPSPRDSRVTRTSITTGPSVRKACLPEPCFALNLMIADDRGHDRSALEMVVKPRSGFEERERFAVTLEATSEHPRFRLIHLAAGEALFAGQVAYLR